MFLADLALHEPVCDRITRTQQEKIMDSKQQPIYVAPDDPDDHLTMEELFGSDEIISVPDIEDLEDDDLCEMMPGCAERERVQKDLEPQPSGAD